MFGCRISVKCCTLFVFGVTTFWLSSVWIFREKMNRWELNFILTSCTVCAMNGGLWWYTECPVNWSNFYIVGHHGKTHLYRESYSVSLLNPRFSLYSVRTDGFMTVVYASHVVISESVDWSSWNVVCHLSSKYWFLKITLFLNVTPCISYQTTTAHKLCYITSFNLSSTACHSWLTFTGEKHPSTLVEIYKVITCYVWVIETTSDNCYEA